MRFSVLFWIFCASLMATLLFSTLSYAMRIVSRMKLEAALLKAGRPTVLDEILDARYDLALTASILRLMTNTVTILSTGWYFLSTYWASPHPFKVFGSTLLITVPMLLIFSVAIPQAWAKYAGEDLLARTWPILRLSQRLVRPLVRVLSIFDEVVRRLAGVSIGEDAETTADARGQDILSAVAEGTADGAVDEDQQKMIERVISFSDLQTGQIMTPRTEIVAMDVTASLSDIRDRILKEGLSRVPIYENTLDNIIGILYAKDLLAFLNTGPSGNVLVGSAEKIDIRKLMRAPYFVPRTKPLRDLLREFKQQRVHLAIVLDEYGGTSGLLTTEDILEEIVGDIADEYERPAPEELKRIDDQTVEVDAKMNIPELNRALDLQLPEDGDFQTLGGFVLSTLGIIPAKGETMEFEGVQITVLDADARRIKKLQVKVPTHAIEEGTEIEAFSMGD